MNSTSFLVRVPATIGNFAGALNSAALALDAPLNVKVTTRGDGQVGIRYFGEHGDRVPRDRSNWVVLAFEGALRSKGYDFTGADFEIFSSVPVGVGLGASTAAVLAGLIAADRLYPLHLDEGALLDLASSFESRTENLRAAWFGGFVACLDRTSPFRRTPVQRDVCLSVVIPESVLPAVEGGSSGMPRLAGASPGGSAVHFARARKLEEFLARAAQNDEPAVFAPSASPGHNAVPGLEDALAVQTADLISVFVCGSGPAIGILAQDDSGLAVEEVRTCFARHGVVSRAVQFRPTNAGAKEWNAVLGETALPSASRPSAPAERSKAVSARPVPQF